MIGKGDREAGTISAKLLLKRDARMGDGRNWWRIMPKGRSYYQWCSTLCSLPISQTSASELEVITGIKQIQ